MPPVLLVTQLTPLPLIDMASTPPLKGPRAVSRGANTLRIPGPCHSSGSDETETRGSLPLSSSGGAGDSLQGVDVRRILRDSHCSSADENTVDTEGEDGVSQSQGESSMCESTMQNSQPVHEQHSMSSQCKTGSSSLNNSCPQSSSCSGDSSTHAGEGPQDSEIVSVLKRKDSSKDKTRPRKVSVSEPRGTPELGQTSGHSSPTSANASDDLRTVRDSGKVPENPGRDRKHPHSVPENRASETLRPGQETMEGKSPENQRKIPESLPKTPGKRVPGAPSVVPRRRISFPADSVLTAVIQDRDTVELLRLLTGRQGPGLVARSGAGGEPQGVDVRQTNHAGLTALHHAILADNLDAAKLLLCHGADVNAQDVHGFSPLHTAAACGFLPLTSLLLLFGADVFAQTREHELPIDVAKELSVVRVLSAEMTRLVQSELWFTSLLRARAEDAWLFVRKVLACMLLLLLQLWDCLRTGWAGHSKTD